MTRFNIAALTISDFMDQTRQSAFVSNIHSSKQYEYLLGHQKTPTFTVLMEVAAAYALTEEKMDPFPELEQKSNQNSQAARTEPRYPDTCTNRPHRSYRPTNRLQVTKGSSNRQVQYNPG